MSGNQIAKRQSARTSRARAVGSLRSINVISAAALSALPVGMALAQYTFDDTTTSADLQGALNTGGLYGQVYNSFPMQRFNVGGNALNPGAFNVPAAPLFNPDGFLTLQTQLNNSSPTAAGGTGYSSVSFANPENSNTYGAGPPFGGTNTVVMQVAAIDDLVGRWSGYFNATNAGTFTFATRSDDGSVVYVDGVRMNGFGGNNAFQGATTRGGTISLTPGLHEIVVAFYEGNGGAGVTLHNNLTSAGNANLIPVLSGFTQILSGPQNTVLNSGSNVTLSGSAPATLRVQGALQTQFGSLNVTNPNATLVLQGTTALFTSTNINAGGPATVTLRGSTSSAFAQDLYLGALNDNGQAAIINNGNGNTLILDNTVSANTAGSTTFNVNGGGIVLVGANAANDPAGGAAINLNAAPNSNIATTNLVLSSKSGTATFGSKINVVDNAVIGSYQFGGNSASGVTTALTHPDGLAVPLGKRLTIGSDQGNTLRVDGPISGPGTLRIANAISGRTANVPTGIVTLAAGTNVSALTGNVLMNQAGTLNIQSPVTLAGTSQFVMNTTVNTLTPNPINVNNLAAPAVNATAAVTGGTLMIINGTYNANAVGSVGFDALTTHPAGTGGAHAVNYNVANAAGGRTVNLTGALPANGSAGVQLNLSTNLTGGFGSDTFSVGPSHIINVGSSAVASLLDRGPAIGGTKNLVLSPMAILAGPNLASVQAVQNLGTDADIYAGMTGTWGSTTTPENITLGAGTPFRGLSVDRTDRRLLNGNITLNGPAEIKSWQGYNSGPTTEAVVTGVGGRVFLGNASNAGTVNILPGPNGPQELTFQGYTLIQTGLAGAGGSAQANTGNFSGASKFIIAPGAVIQTDTTNAFGGAGGSAKPTLEVMAGGMLDPGVGNTTAGSEAGSINTNTLLRAGATLLLNDNGNLNSPIGTITAEPGAVYRLTANQPLGMQSPGSVPGTIVRLAGGPFNNLDANFDDGAVYVVRGANRTLNGSLGLNGQITGTNFAEITGVLTNDNASRQINSANATPTDVISLNVGTSGATLAASTGTTFTVGNSTTTIGRMNFNAGNSPIQINATQTIDGLVKNGIVAWTGQNTTNGPMATWRSGPVNIVAGTFRHAGGGADYVVSGGTGTTTVNPGTTFESNTGALIDSRLVIMSGGTARFTATSTPSVSSIEGGGNLILGNTTGSGTIPLSTGQNNLSTTFGGVISQATGFTGSLTKVGTGMLTLTGANTYGGGTRVNAGALLVNNTTGSGTGTGPVTVTNGATLGGIGTVGGNTAGNLVNVLSGGRLDMGVANGTLGRADVGTLTVSNASASPGSGTNSTVLLSPGSNLVVDLDFTGPGVYDLLRVLGTLQLTDANLDLRVFGQPAGTEQMMIIDNDLADPVGGTFAGLAEGSVVTVGGMPFTISYVGGDGNDVVLAGVPEPGAIGALGLAAVAGLARRRRRM